uniref:DNA-directed RNA polymerase subunit alpha n=1 Tax=Trieres chinensis TaxID=1514140 RepID=RPOA_TRICV|nr:RNA polymerase alpha subunit [Trieres chinensis]P49465.1 RecName: Full=DNA-directed RNA polymerase subunit alpha; Short=PEP; AltName: Full=Plastid-encoded RNA polymerase subunit alpha; Short=RNA polymerase subunit alpha [Trieres chinensis]CAA91627.1 RNA polymerase alpha-chain [Trieres chinensis]
MNNFYIKCLKSKKVESGSIYGQFVIKSLHPGQGITIGNLFRRVLLSDLGGTAITGVRIAGVRDEFSTIPGIREDILEILLNLKGIVLKSKTNDLKFGRLKIKGPAVVTANCIQLPSEVEIVNPNHYIATITTSNVLEIEFKIESGTGYKLAGQTFCKKSQDYLQIDAIFMPVQKVDFKIENIYDNSNDLTERLFLDIWTNGSMSPEEAVSSASRFIISFFSSLLENKLPQETKESENKTLSAPKNPHTNIAIEELHLSVRAYNCLKRAQINTIGDLLKYSPEKLQELKNFGRKSADEVFTTLKNKLGIVLSN